MGALYLARLDERLEGLPGIHYTRFMDDWVILAETRAQLRRAVRIANQTLADLGVEKHPDKTFIGRVAHGFDFLAYRFHPGSLQLAPVAVERMAKHLSLLYEQGASSRRAGRYVTRWVAWANGGLRTSAASASRLTGTS